MADSACIAFRRASSRAGPGGSRSACSRWSFASSIKRFSRETVCLIRGRLFIINTPHAESLSMQHFGCRYQAIWHKAAQLAQAGRRPNSPPRAIRSRSMGFHRTRVAPGLKPMSRPHSQRASHHRHPLAAQDPQPEGRAEAAQPHRHPHGGIILDRRAGRGSALRDGTSAPSETPARTAGKQDSEV